MTTTSQLQVIDITDPSSAEPVRDLLRTFVQWHFERHTEDKDLISEYFDKASFDKELEELPGKYVSPDGALLLAYYNEEPAGCVALKRIDAESCEMKRMFVYPRVQGAGVGKALAVAIVEKARALGFHKMKLDTSHRQIEAQRLYQRIGFVNCEPYYELPERLKNWLVFMEMEL